MKKRTFLKMTGIFGAGVVVAPFMACSDATPPVTPAATEPAPNPPVFALPELGFAFNALEPRIDAMTMEIHHGKHHAGYVKNLNAALEGSTTYNDMTLEAILAQLGEDDTAIRNNAGGHFNHSMYWKTIAPGGGATPTGALADALSATFGSIEVFGEQFSAAAMSRFGSGWAWLSLSADQRLIVSSTPNQDNPLMNNLVPEPATPILGIDVWEHAYYLNYQNRRADYVKAFMELVNWDAVSANFAALNP
jgi:Fe-Mn family superoxide dismutase